MVYNLHQCMLIINNYTLVQSCNGCENSESVIACDYMLLAQSRPTYPMHTTSIIGYNSVAPPPLSYEYYYTLCFPFRFRFSSLVQLSCLLVHVRMYLLRRAIPILSCALFTFFLVMLAWRATPRTPGPPKPWPHPQMEPREFEGPSLFLVTYGHRRQGIMLIL